MMPTRLRKRVKLVRQALEATRIIEPMEEAMPEKTPGKAPNGKAVEQKFRQDLTDIAEQSRKEVVAAIAALSPLLPEDRKKLDAIYKAVELYALSMQELGKLLGREAMFEGFERALHRMEEQRQEAIERAENERLLQSTPPAVRERILAEMKAREEAITRGKPLIEVLGPRQVSETEDGKVVESLLKDEK